MKMKTNHLRNYIAIAVVILLSSGCKSPSLLSEEKVALPETFVGGTSDTLSMANLSWKEFFPDTYLKAYIDTALVRNHSFLQTLERVSLAREQLRVGPTHDVPESFGIARESMLPYVHVTMYPFPVMYPFSFLSAPRTLAISLPTLGLSVTIAIIFFFFLMFRAVSGGTERGLNLLFPG